MNKYFIILMAAASMVSLQASDELSDSIHSSACPSPYLQPGDGISQLTAELLAAKKHEQLTACRFTVLTIDTQIERDRDMVKAGHSISQQFKRNEVSAEDLSSLVRGAQQSPIPGKAASFTDGFNKNIRMESPTYKALKNKYNAEDTSPELREACKRKMMLILNK